MTETSEIWTGKASSYDRVRPTTPPALLDLLTQLIDMPHPALVVDVGSGTGLSTAIWGERAERVILSPRHFLEAKGKAPLLMVPTQG
jgi:protein-L-isoaspartate O-methyltransferase